MYQENGNSDPDFSQITASQKQEKNLDPHEPRVLFWGTRGEKESAGKTELGRNPRSSIQQGFSDLHQRISKLSVGSCRQIIGFCTGSGNFCSGIGRVTWQARHPKLGGPWEAYPRWWHRAWRWDSMGNHYYRSGNGPEEGRIIHSNHPDDSGLQDKLIDQKNGVITTGLCQQDQGSDLRIQPATPEDCATRKLGNLDVQKRRQELGGGPSVDGKNPRQGRGTKEPRGNWDNH